MAVEPFQERANSISRENQKRLSMRLTAKRMRMNSPVVVSWAGSGALGLALAGMETARMHARSAMTEKEAIALMLPHPMIKCFFGL